MIYRGTRELVKKKSFSSDLLESPQDWALRSCQWQFCNTLHHGLDESFYLANSLVLSSCMYMYNQRK